MVILIPAVYFIKWLKDDAAISYSFVFIFFLTSVTYYYYLILVIPFLFFAERLNKPGYTAGLIYMYLTGLAGYVFFSGWDPLWESMAIFHGWHQYFPTYYYLSWMVCGTAITMILLAGLEARSESNKSMTSS